MKIQYGSIELKMVSIVCAAIFFVCATPLLKPGAKTTGTQVEILKLSD